MAEFDSVPAPEITLTGDTADADREAVAQQSDRGNRPPLAARIVLDRLAEIRQGHLVVRPPDGSKRTFAGFCAGATAVIELDVHRWRFFSRLLRRADVGAGEAYVDGDGSSPDLVGLSRGGRGAEIGRVSS